jgi:hypothetical protein
VSGNISAANGQARERFLLMWAANPADGSQTVIGPATIFRAVGPSLRLGPRGLETAHFRNGLWRRRKIGGRFSLLWTEAVTEVRFEDPSTGSNLVVGPFEMVGFVCNTIYVDRERSRPVACLDESTGKWRSCADGSLWPEVVLEPTPRAAISGNELFLRAMNGSAA